MPMFTDTVLNSKTGRHELHFVNQQYDLLMLIYFDEKEKAYKWSCSEEEAQQNVKSLGKELDCEQVLKEAEQDLKKADLQVLWDKSILQLSDTKGDDIKAAVKAAKTISKMADVGNIKQLYALVQSEDIFIREAVAEPLGRLEGVRALPALFHALNTGERDGHDNDTLTSTIIDVVESGKKNAAPFLLKMLKSHNAGKRADAIWALGFISSVLAPDVFFDVYLNDPDPEVRSMAADALPIYLDKKQKTLPDAEAFFGKWMWLDCEAQLQYGFDIQGVEGICIKNNTTTYAIGDVMLKITLTSGLAFVGKQIFTNGFWYAVTCRREENKLHVQGAGLNWTMERID